MRRQTQTMRIGGITIVLVLLLLPSAVAAVNTTFLWGPYVTGTNGTATVVSWKTAEPSTGTVAYTTAGEEVRTVVDPAVAALHHVRLTNLTAGTTYSYSVAAGDVRSQECRFMTAGSGSFTFAVYSDTRGQIPLFTQMERHKLVADRIAREENLSFVIHCGDFVTFGNDLAEWNEYFGAARNMLANTTLVPTLGNHEGNRTPYYDTFGVPEWYSFDWGDARIIVLDSNDWAKGRLDEETAWLEDKLQQNETWKFVAFHHPVYSSNDRNWGGNQLLRLTWTPLFDRYNVTAVFNGHTHAYEHYSVNDTEYFVVPCGGEELFNLSSERPAGFRTSLEHTLAYLRVTVDVDEVRIDVVPVAKISEDNTEVVQVYPPGKIFETVTLPARSLQNSYLPDMLRNFRETLHETIA